LSLFQAQSRFHDSIGVLYSGSCGAGARNVNYEYKCVAGPTIVAVKSAKARDQAVKAFEDIMNREAGDGWEYVGIDEFHVSEPQGLFTRKRVYVPAKILVFRRPKDAPAAEMTKPAAATASAAPLLMPPSSGAQDDADDAKTSIKTIADKLTAKKPA
jgi:hypothetical protein